MQCNHLLLGGLLMLASPAAHAQSTSTKVNAPSRAVERATHRLVTVGALLLGAAYVPSFVMGAISTVDGITHIQIFCNDNSDAILSSGPCRHNDAALMMIPLAGPIAYASPSDRDHVFRPDGNPSGLEQALLVTDGILQATGLGLLLFAALYREANIPAAPLKTSAPQTEYWTLTPTLTSNRMEGDATYRF